MAAWAGRVARVVRGLGRDVGATDGRSEPSSAELDATSVRPTLAVSEVTGSSSTPSPPDQRDHDRVGRLATPNAAPVLTAFLELKAADARWFRAEPLPLPKTTCDVLVMAAGSAWLRATGLLSREVTALPATSTEHHQCGSACDESLEVSSCSTVSGFAPVSRLWSWAPAAESGADGGGWEAAEAAEATEAKGSASGSASGSAVITASGATGAGMARPCGGAAAGVVRARRVSGWVERSCATGEAVGFAAELVVGPHVVRGSWSIDLLRRGPRRLCGDTSGGEDGAPCSRQRGGAGVAGAGAGAGVAGDASALLESAAAGLMSSLRLTSLAAFDAHDMGPGLAAAEVSGPQPRPVQPVVGDAVSASGSCRLVPALAFVCRPAVTSQSAREMQRQHL